MSELHRVRVWAEALIAHTSTSRGRSGSTTPSGAPDCATTRASASASRATSRRATTTTPTTRPCCTRSRTRSRAPRRGTARAGRPSPANSATSAARRTAARPRPSSPRGSASAPPGTLAYRHRRATRPTSCAKCAPRFDDRFVFTWSRREITPAARLAAMTPRLRRPAQSAGVRARGRRRREGPGRRMPHPRPPPRAPRRAARVR